MYPFWGTPLPLAALLPCCQPAFCSPYWLLLIRRAAATIVLAASFVLVQQPQNATATAGWRQGRGIVSADVHLNAYCCALTTPVSCLLAHPCYCLAKSCNVFLVFLHRAWICIKSGSYLGDLPGFSIWKIQVCVKESLWVSNFNGFLNFNIILKKKVSPLKCKYWK